MKTPIFFQTFFLTLSLLFSFSGSAQTTNVQNEIFGSLGRNELSVNKNKPNIKYKVTKKYDENGNLISYDSSYSYTFVSPHSEDITADSDTSCIDFFSGFFKNIPGIFKDPFHSLLLPETDIEKNLLEPDFYFHNMPQDSIFLKMHRQMDSLRKEFLKK